MKNLHSHLHQSPLSHNQEVSAFGDNGDEGDTGTWLRSERITLFFSQQLD